MGNIPPSILRQPPSPSSTPAAASKEKGKIESEMVGGNMNSIRTYYSRRCKRKRLTDIESLPDEVLFEVLVRLPAQDIYDSARLVCSKWYHMIHTHTFIQAHLQHSTFGLLFQSRVGEDSFFMAVGKSGKTEISKYNYKLRCPVSTSCNGLSLEYQKSNLDNLYISNPATRQIFVLPPNGSKVVDKYGIGYAVASKEYKAVITFPSAERYKGTCYILTIGIDKSWRTFGVERVSVEATQGFLRSPLFAEGFMLWYFNPSNAVLTLNLETEVITETRGPTIPRGVYGTRRNVYLPTGRYFSALTQCGEFCWEVWEMKPKIDYRWRKVSDVSLEAHKCSTFEHLGFKHLIFEDSEFVIPIGWVKYLEVLVFGVSGGQRPLIFVFNLISQEISTIELPTKCARYSYVLHKNSLVWLGGC